MNQTYVAFGSDRISNGRNKKARTVQQNGKIKRYREREILFIDLRQMGSPYEKKYIELTEEERRQPMYFIRGSGKVMKKLIKMFQNSATVLLLKKLKKKILNLFLAVILSSPTGMKILILTVR